MEKLKLGMTEDARGECEKHGPFEGHKFAVGGKWLGPLCPDCTAEKEAQRKAEQDQEQREQRMESLLEYCSIPHRFQGATLANYQPINDAAKKIHGACQRYCEGWPERFKAGSSLILSGSVGTGKTHLACGIAQELIRRYCARVKYSSVAEVMRVIRSTYNRAEPLSEEEVLQRLINLDLLILDEVGVQLGSDHEHTMLFEILNGRYMAMRPTVLVTNLGASELTKTVGERVVDRFREGGALLSFTWESYRKAA